MTTTDQKSPAARLRAVATLIPSLLNASFALAPLTAEQEALLADYRRLTDEGALTDASTLAAAGVEPAHLLILNGALIWSDPEDWAARFAAPINQPGGLYTIHTPPPPIEDLLDSYQRGQAR